MGAVLGTAARLAMLMAVIGASGFAVAGNFALSPLRVSLAPGKTIDSLTLRNEGDEPAVMQIEMVEWRQQAGEDLMVPTREVLATPPIFTVAPKATQIIRVGLRRAPATDQELSYRMFLQEVLPPPREGVLGLQVALRLSLPVFVNPAQAVRPVLQWKAVAGGPGMTRLHLTNSGTSHIQMLQLKLARSDGEALDVEQAPVYVLPGQSRQWTIRQEVAAGSTLRLAARSDTGDISADVLVDRP